jgi:hypothetical protein
LEEKDAKDSYFCAGGNALAMAGNVEAEGKQKSFACFL